MSRKQFIESHGATGRNWSFWSFINEAEKFIIFGAWDYRTKGNKSLIFSGKWERRGGRKQNSYEHTLRHIKLIEEEGYKLKTFPQHGTEASDDKPAKVHGFTKKLYDRVLLREGKDWYDWYAIDEGQDFVIPEEVELNSSETYPEGARSTITVNSYERNQKARNKCIEHYGYSCAVCDLNFEEMYGFLGTDYIHVHHTVPVSKRKKEYKVDPIKHLIPVCPNCHAMIHREEPALTVRKLKARIDKEKRKA